MSAKPLWRLAAFLLVVALHAGLAVALANGLGRSAVEPARPPLIAAIISEPAPAPPEPIPVPEPASIPEPPPPPPVAEIPPPPPAAPAPAPEPPARKPPPRAVAKPVAPAKPIPAAAPPAATPVSAPPRPDPVRHSAVIDAAGTCRLPQYPPLSRRNGETGTVTLKFLIDADGTMLDSHVEASSGHERLDEAARQALALCRFKPGSVDGVPERSWARMRYVWKLD